MISLNIEDYDENLDEIGNDIVEEVSDDILIRLDKPFIWGAKRYNNIDELCKEAGFTGNRAAAFKKNVLKFRNISKALEITYGIEEEIAKDRRIDNEKELIKIIFDYTDVNKRIFISLIEDYVSTIEAWRVYNDNYNVECTCKDIKKLTDVNDKLDSMNLRGSRLSSVIKDLRKLIDNTLEKLSDADDKNRYNAELNRIEKEYNLNKKLYGSLLSDLIYFQNNHMHLIDNETFYRYITVLKSSNHLYPKIKYTSSKITQSVASIGFDNKSLDRPEGSKNDNWDLLQMIFKNANALKSVKINAGILDGARFIKFTAEDIEHINNLSFAYLGTLLEYAFGFYGLLDICKFMPRNLNPNAQNGMMILLGRYFMSKNTFFCKSYYRVSDADDDLTMYKDAALYVLRIIFYLYVLDKTSVKVNMKFYSRY